MERPSKGARCAVGVALLPLARAVDAVTRAVVEALRIQAFGTPRACLSQAYDARVWLRLAKLVGAYVSHDSCLPVCTSWTLLFRTLTSEATGAVLRPSKLSARLVIPPYPHWMVARRWISVVSLLFRHSDTYDDTSGGMTIQRKAVPDVSMPLNYLVMSKEVSIPFAW